jgi:hypothetical protein
MSDHAGKLSRTARTSGAEAATGVSPGKLTSVEQAHGDRSVSVGKRTLVESLQLQQRELTVQSDVHASARAAVSGGASPLPFRDRIQALFGRHDVSGVQAHTDGTAAAATRAMGAEAFAMGEHVGFAGTPTLHTAAHEAAHVIQQRGGVQLKGGVGQAGDVYERHADEVADAVVAGHSAEVLLTPFAGNGGGAPAVQRAEIGVHDDQKNVTHHVKYQQLSAEIEAKHGKRFLVTLPSGFDPALRSKIAEQLDTPLDKLDFVNEQHDIVDYTKDGEGQSDARPTCPITPRSIVPRSW